MLTSIWPARGSAGPGTGSALPHRPQLRVTPTAAPLHYAGAAAAARRRLGRLRPRRATRRATGACGGCARRPGGPCRHFRAGSEVGGRCREGAGLGRGGSRAARGGAVGVGPRRGLRQVPAAAALGWWFCVLTASRGFICRQGNCGPAGQHLGRSRTEGAASGRPPAPPAPPERSLAARLGQPTDPRRGRALVSRGHRAWGRSIGSRPGGRAAGAGSAPAALSGPLRLRLPRGG